MVGKLCPYDGCTARRRHAPREALLPKLTTKTGVGMLTLAPLAETLTQEPARWLVRTALTRLCGLIGCPDGTRRAVRGEHGGL